MLRIINELVSSGLQLAVFTLVPFLFFLFRKDKTVSFLRYIGLYAAPTKSIRLSIITSLLFVAGGLGMIFLDEGIRTMVTTAPSVTGKLRQEESPVLAAGLILIIALMKTSFTEEIFFRGFLAKRLINWLGFATGNLIQALIFGVVHVLLFWQLMHAGVFALAFIFTFSTLAGWIVGNIKEKHGNGSIVPGWVAHGLGNLVSYTVIVFFV